MAWTVRVVLVALLIGPGCGIDTLPDLEVPPEAPDAAPPTPELLDTVEPRLVGTYASHLQVAQRQTVPVIGERTSTQITIGLATIRRDGDHFILEERGCHVVPQTGGAVSTTIDDAVPRSVPPLAVRLDVFAAGEAVGWRRARSLITVGVELDDPEHDTLPDDSNDPRVFDQDGDGRPGVTAHIGGLTSGNVYVVQRQRFEAEGTLLADGELRGLVKDYSQQSVVGASTWVLDSQVPSVQEKDPSKSFLRLRRVADAETCESVVAHRESLFP